MLRTLILVGVMSAAAVAANWQCIVKEGIKLGLRTGRRVGEASSRVIEDLQDLAAAAAAEVDHEDSGGKTPRAER
jgi:hypothetical protein